MSLTRTAVRTKVIELIGTASVTFVTEAEMNEWIDDACRDISVKTLCNQVICSAIATVNLHG